MRNKDHVKFERFSTKAHIEIDANLHKGELLEWRDFNDMIVELEYHKAKMLMAIRVNDKKAVAEFIADQVAVLFAIGNLGGLYDRPVIDDMMCAETVKEPFQRVMREPVTRDVLNVSQNYIQDES